ncbi:restriction endonuclease subunit S, partial [Desulfovibrio sp. SGI.102]|uniref:restriction endonuclease subunit S n=1 Tax=Desulfovibrio sp. SGI.102 TaxID=3420559 RepID=UPI003D0331C7
SQKTNFQKRGEGGAQPNIFKEKIIITLMPLPPLAEQQRIVARLEELLPDVEAYGTAQERLTTLESSFPQQLRKSLLQEAIQGRLVPQNPDDEPADVLLQRIRAEKEQLIKEGKIKKQKPLPPITEEEKPFTIPDSWQWVRLGDLAARINYGFTASASMHGDIKFLRITDINIKTNAVNWNSVPFCTIDKNKINSYLLLPNDILIARTGGTIGKFYIVDKKIPKSVFASYLIRISLIKNITTKYIGIFLSSPAYWSQIIDSSMGTGQPNVNSIALASLKLPFPPLAEQQRIVARLEELLPLCDGLLSAGGQA